ncbi:MAG TPA: molybdopterin molybdenumtransferase MoeA [Clostridiales bacterium UBA8960]|nr:molybdopterin molybdenumtransferase MoeA [Clostridiales bacterium UBA8960]
MDFFDVMTLDEALKLIDDSVPGGIELETVLLNEAVDRIVGKPVYAPIDLPDFNRSTVDGYAVVAGDVQGASEGMPSMMKVVGESVMGKQSNHVIHTGEAVYVPTGGEVPEGADGVVMIEYCERLDAQTILVKHPIHHGENMTFIGDDMRKGERLYRAGRKLSAYDVGLLAGLGVSELTVFRKLRAAVISTGDEIIAVDAPYCAGKIRDINGNALVASLIRQGVTVTGHDLIGDDFEALKRAFDEALSVSDTVIFSGGSSVGAKDYTMKVIMSDQSSELLVHGLAIKPGKPTIIGKVDGKLIFGLPGHPSAALLLYNLVVVPYFNALTGNRDMPFSVTATLERRVHGAPGRDMFVMVSLKYDNALKGYIAYPIHAKSGMISLLSKADGYIRLSRDEEGLLEGSNVTVHLLKNAHQLGEDTYE